MSSIARILLVLFVVLILGGAMFLVTWDIPPPTAHIERVIPNEQLSR